MLDIGKYVLIGQIPNHFDIQYDKVGRTYRFAITVTKNSDNALQNYIFENIDISTVPIIKTSDTQLYDLSNITNSLNTIFKFTMTVDGFPQLSVNTSNYTYINKEYGIPMNTTLSDKMFSVTFYEIDGLQIYKIFYHYMHFIYDYDNKLLKQTNKQKYQIDINVMLYSPYETQDNIVLKYVFKNQFPSKLSISNNTLSFENPAIINTTVEFTYDEVDIIDSNNNIIVNIK